MDMVSEIDEIMNEVFIRIKELFSFLEISDSNIYKLIRKNLGNNKSVTKEDLLVKTIKCCSKWLIKNVAEDRYDELDSFFEQEFSCYDSCEGLVRLDVLFSSVSGKKLSDLYLKLFRRYDVLSLKLMNILDDYDYSFSKVKKSNLDKRVLRIVKIYYEFYVVNRNVDEIEEDIEFDDGADIDYVYLKTNNEALARYIDMNICLVTSIAGKYKGAGVSFDDLVQEGLIGFIKAIYKYDPSSKAKLSSYAYTSIERHILRAINSDSRNIRIPDWRCEELKKYIRVKNEFINSHGVEPTVEEMSDLLKISLEMAKESEVLSTNYICSLNLKVDIESETEYGELIEDVSFPMPEEYIIEISMVEEINMILEEVLTEQEKAVIDLAFGRYDGVVRNNAEVGEAIYEYGLYPKPLTRERVRQLRSGAIKKLKESEYVKRLEAYL